MASVEQRMTERRERILEAARRLIETRGYERLTMRELAVASGVTVPTLYNLVGAKEAVLLAAVDEQTRGFTSALERARGDLVEVVEAAVRQLVRRPRYSRSLLCVLAQPMRAGAARKLVSRALGAQIERALGDLAAAGQLAGWVDPCALADRLHARIDDAALDWAHGGLSAAGFRAVALFDVATAMLGVTSGTSHARFLRVARGEQAAARRPRRARRRAA